MPPRSRSQRQADVQAKLRDDVDLWVASADETGEAYLVPLSFHWDGAALTLATPRASPTAVNLLRAGRARVALGPTRDVVIVEGTVAELPRGDDPELERGVRRGGRVRPARGLCLPAHHAARDPGMARGGRARRPPADARRRLALACRASCAHTFASPPPLSRGRRPSCKATAGASACSPTASSGSSGPRTAPSRTAPPPSPSTATSRCRSSRSSTARRRWRSSPTACG